MESWKFIGVAERLSHNFVLNVRLREDADGGCVPRICGTASIGLQLADFDEVEVRLREVVSMVRPRTWHVVLAFRIV